MEHLFLVDCDCLPVLEVYLIYWRALKFCQEWRPMNWSRCHKILGPGVNLWSHVFTTERERQIIKSLLFWWLPLSVGRIDCCSASSFAYCYTFYLSLVRLFLPITFMRSIPWLNRSMDSDAIWQVLVLSDGSLCQMMSQENGTYASQILAKTCHQSSAASRQIGLLSNYFGALLSSYHHCHCYCNVCQGHPFIRKSEQDCEKEVNFGRWVCLVMGLATSSD